MPAAQQPGQPVTPAWFTLQLIPFASSGASVHQNGNETGTDGAGPTERFGRDISGNPPLPTPDLAYASQPDLSRDTTTSIPL